MEGWPWARTVAPLPAVSTCLERQTFWFCDNNWLRYCQSKFRDLWTLTSFSRTGSMPHTPFRHLWTSLAEKDRVNHGRTTSRNGQASHCRHHTKYQLPITLSWFRYTYTCARTIPLSENAMLAFRLKNRGWFLLKIADSKACDWMMPAPVYLGYLPGVAAAPLLLVALTIDNIYGVQFSSCLVGYQDFASNKQARLMRSK